MRAHMYVYVVSTARGAVAVSVPGAEETLWPRDSHVAQSWTPASAVARTARLHSCSSVEETPKETPRRRCDGADSAAQLDAPDLARLRVRAQQQRQQQQWQWWLS